MRSAAIHSPSHPRAGAERGRRARPIDPVAQPNPLASNCLVEISTVGLLVIGSRSKLSRRLSTERVEHERSIAIDVEVLELASKHSPTLSSPPR